MLLVMANGAACSIVSAMNKQEVLETDPLRWSSFAFDHGANVVTIKVPAGYREFNNQLNSWPQIKYDNRSERYLLQKQYDFGKSATFELPEFVINAHFTKLSEGLPTTNLTKQVLTNALNALPRHSMHADGHADSGIEIIDGREWIHYDYGAQEMYSTLVDASTVLTVTGAYGKNIRKNESWLSSRKQVLQLIRARISIRAQ